jgi:adenylate cyclase
MAATRRLAAILAADVAGYSRLMGADEEGTHERLKAHLRQLIDPKIREHQGRVVKNTGDGMLAEFASVLDAVRCAAQIQRGMIDRDKDMPDINRIKFRIGVNLGDVIVEEHDIFGDGVNVAARLEALAEPGGICVSATVHDQVRDKLPYPFDDMGEQRLKNIARPVRVYAIDTASPRISLGSKTANPTPRISIIVLPFASLSPDPKQEYFADAITDDLTTDLSRIADSFVIARTTAFTYKGKAVDVRQVASDLGIRYVLGGSVRRMGEQVQVNVQLIDGESGSHVWAERFGTDLRELMVTQNEIVGRLARTLNTELVRDIGRRIDRERAADPDARDLVMRARVLAIQTLSVASNNRDVLRPATIDLLERALTLDPGSIDARIHLASLLTTDIADGFSSSVDRDEARAEQLIGEALERDPNRSLAHAVIGLLRRVQGRWAESQTELETAISLDQNNAWAISQLGRTLLIQGKPEAAIPLLEKAIRLDPRAPYAFTFYFSLGTCHLYLGRNDEAVDLYRQARALNSAFWYVHLFLAGALGLTGDIDEAKRAIADALKLKPEANSLARLREIAATQGYGSRQIQAGWEKTIYTGLRRAGYPEE